MNDFVDVPCPTGPDKRRGKTVSSRSLSGTRWLHNPHQRRWYMVALCPHCRGVHKPHGIREDRLVIPKKAM